MNPPGRDVYRISLTASDLEQATAVIGRIFCPDPDHAPPCPVPWESRSSVTDGSADFTFYATADQAHEIIAEVGGRGFADARLFRSVGADGRTIDGSDLIEQFQVEQFQVEQLPVGQLPVEQLPVEQLPVEQLPVEQLPVEQLPVEQVFPGAERMMTARLSLRRPVPADADAISSINGNAQACLHNPSDLVATRAEADQLSQRWDEHWRRFGFGYWVVRRRDSDAAIGFCGIKVMRLGGSEVANLFYRFDPAVWGSGLATEAARAVTGWAASNIPNRPLIARIRPENVASQHVATHAGLVRAGHLDTAGEDGPDWIYAWPGATFPD